MPRRRRSEGFPETFLPGVAAAADMAMAGELAKDRRRRAAEAPRIAPPIIVDSKEL